MIETRLERRARRCARRLGLQAHKSQWRIDTKDNLGQFQLLDSQRHRIVAGEKFDLTAEEVIAFCQARVMKDLELWSAAPRDY